MIKSRFLQIPTINLIDLEKDAALLKRFDEKYLVDTDHIENFLSESSSNLSILQIDKLREFQYSSTYYDSESLTSWRDHIQGKRRRFKCRVREYSNSNDSFVEVKLKGNKGETIKSRKRLNASLDSSNLRNYLDSVLVSMGYSRYEEELVPVLQVNYKRKTFLASVTNEKITVDSEIWFHNLLNDASENLGENVHILEIKSNRIDSNFRATLLKQGNRPSSLSKYILGTVLTNPNVSKNLYLPLIRSLSKIRNNASA